MNQNIRVVTLLLERLEASLFDDKPISIFPTKVDVRPVAKELGLDMDEVLEEITRICKTKHYHVGGHMDCTRDNVLPRYRASGEINLDKDHLEGLRQILRVEYGLRQDY